MRRPAMMAAIGGILFIFLAVATAIGAAAQVRWEIAMYLGSAVAGFLVGMWLPITSPRGPRSRTAADA